MVGVLEDPLVAGADLGEGVMIEEEDTIVAMHLEVATEEDIEVDQEATPHIKNYKREARLLLALQYYRQTGGHRKTISRITGHRSRLSDP